MLHSCQELLFGVFRLGSWQEHSSHLSLMGQTENLGKVQERSVALYFKGFSILIEGVSPTGN